MKKKIRVIAMLTAAVTMAMALAGCGGKTNVSEGETELTYWAPLSANASQTASNLGETEFAKALMEAVGCNVKYQHPAQGSDAESFNVMVAAGKLPDIIEYNWLSAYPGGAEKALDDGIIQEIDLEKDAPNLAKYVKEHPEIDKYIKTESGRYFGFPFIRGDDYLLTSAGLIVRQDWLDDLNLDKPETIDDWTEMLMQFKEKKNASAPLTLSTGQMNSYGVFVGSYDTYDGLYVRDGKVTYGPLDDSYKEFLGTMHSWYEKGLLDPDFATADGSSTQSNMLNGVSGAAFGSCGSGIGKWMAAAPDDKFNLSGVQYPVINKGDQPQFGQYTSPVAGRFAVITRDCKDRETALKLLDYAYSEEGHMLFNFGIEGISYDMVDGYPTYTDKIKNSDEGLSMAAAMAQYTLSQDEGAFVQDKRYMEQYANLPQQQEALKTWMNTNMKNHIMPNVSLSTEQQNELASIVENIETYKLEMENKFIMGVEPLDKFDEFRNELKTRGIEKYIQYEQEAYDKFMNR